MKILVGLGNRGKKHRNSRHNLGFLVIDKISKEKNIPVNKKKFSSLIGESKLFQEKVLLIKPQTYMNISGQAVKSAVSKTKVNLDNLLVICDDVNLPQGVIRIRPSGSAGGHKGLKSIIEFLKTEEFPRLRIGIGTERRQQNEDLTSYVLKPLGKKNKDILNQALEKAKDASYLWLKENITACMNKFNIKANGT